MGCPAKRWIGREGNGAEGRLWLNEIMGFFAFAVLATVTKRRNGLGEMKEWLGFLCMGLCLVSGKNSRFAVVDLSQGFGFVVWVASHGFEFTQSMRAWVAVKLTR